MLAKPVTVEETDRSKDQMVQQNIALQLDCGFARTLSEDHPQKKTAFSRSVISSSCLGGRWQKHQHAHRCLCHLPWPHTMARVQSQS